MPLKRASLLFLTLAMLAPGASSADPPENDGVIHACVRQRSGYVRIVAGPERCRRFE